MSDEYYESDEWVLHENGCWSIRRQGICYLITDEHRIDIRGYGFEKGPQTKWVCHRYFNDDKYIDEMDLKDGIGEVV